MNWKNISVSIGVIFVFFFWMYVPSDEYEDPDDRFTVTFTYDCREVIDDEDIPEHVLEECRKIMKEIQDETRKNKPSI